MGLLLLRDFPPQLALYPLVLALHWGVKSQLEQPDGVPQEVGGAG